ncbi:MAG: hypothetical protein ACFFAH_04835 [Promethearchaeota archaeon]
MKENTKYNDYRFVGKINIEEIQPWFDFATNKPWDDPEIPWVLENKVRREILIKLSEGPKTFNQLYNTINFSPKPLLIKPEEYKCTISYQWTKLTIENHLMNLEWYNLIRKSDDRYELSFPILKMEDINDMEKYISVFAKHWVTIIKETKEKILKELGDLKNDPKFYIILVEKAIEKLYLLLKETNILPQEPNIKALWAEQLRNIKFEKWLEKNF